ncbi:MAG: hypothetical protein ACXWWA_08365 [Chitinophagaceae bacterium]
MKTLYPSTSVLRFSQLLSFPICRILFILICLFLSRISIAQTSANYTRSYLNNVVEIGLSDFGVIISEDSTDIYFIAVRHTVYEKIAKTLKLVKFYGNNYRTKATKVKETHFGPYTVVLYKSARAQVNDWQRHYYFSLAHKKGKLSTFRDKWLSDKIWAVHETKIEVVKPPKKGSSIYILKVPLEAGVAKGMPLVNSDGFIAGIFAESTLGKKMVKAINMKEIANALYVAADSSCRYFNMVEWGKTDIRCELERLAKEAAAEKARKDAEAKAKKGLDKNQPEEKDTAISKKGERKQHFLDYGINANMMADPVLVNNPGRDNYFGNRTFHAGISLHLNIDKRGLNRITLKPRYGNYYERNDGNIWASPDEEVRILITSYQYAEMPVMLERQLFSARKYSMALAIGYAPGWVFDHQYKWVDKSATAYINEKITGSGSSSLTHRLIGELYLYESKAIRFAAVYTKDMTGYPHAEYILPVNGIDYTPFSERKKAWYVGVELGIRLRGSWGKARPSR